ncbi:MAG: diguanylate cyclase domain-containing protein [Planctomycetota bacterium]
MLAVDGDPRDRERIRECLNVPGRELVHVTFAHTIKEACRLAREFRYDCILLDHELPDGRGLDLLAQGNECLLTTPVIALSTSDDGWIPVEYFRAGCIEYFDKREVLQGDALRRGIARAMASHHRRVMAALIERRRLGDAIVTSQEGLITLARSDPQTGICNRAVFDDYQPTYHEEVARRGGTYALCLIAIDKLKSYADQCGRAAGGELLRAVAETLTSSLRENDFIARYGDDQIVLLLDSVSVGTARIVTDRLRQRIFDLSIPHELNTPHRRVTVSVGVGVFDAAFSTTAITVMLSADDALYEAKEAGGNRTVIEASKRADRRIPA